MVDTLFQEAWQKAVRTRTQAEHARRVHREQENRSGIHGVFAQALQLEVDGTYAEVKRAMAHLVTKIES